MKNSEKSVHNGWFEREYSFRYSDLNCKNRIKISTVLDVLQDVSMVHSFEVGLSLEKFRELSVAMILHGWRVRFLEDLDFNLPVTVTTGVMSTGHFSGMRRYEMWQNKSCRVIATAEWIAVDTEAWKITRLPQKIASAYGDYVEDNGLPFARRKTGINGELLCERAVEGRDIDTNNHINNAKSVEIALDYLPDNLEASELHVTYRKQLRMGDCFAVYGCKTDDGYMLELRKDDKMCVAIQVISK